MTVSLRPYQQRAKSEARALIAQGIRKLLVVAPTGAGKSVLFTSIIESAIERGSRCLLLAHRRELLRGPFVRFVRAGLDPSKVGVIMAGVPSGPPKPILGPLQDADDELIWSCLARRRPDAMVQVASIDAIRNRAKPQADLIIIDEAHRVLAASYLKLAEEYQNSVFVGLTATPVRADGKALGNFFQRMICVATYRQLVADGFLMEPRGKTVPARELPDLTRVKIVGGDFDPESLGQACNQTGLVGSITDHWLKFAGGVRTICFAVNREHSETIAQRFRDAGVPAKHVDANTPAQERDAAFRDLRTGSLQVLCNVDIATEGVDVPQIECVILARPSKSLRVVMQQIGRGSRPHPGKKSFLILDHAGNLCEHGWPSLIEFTEDVLHSPKSKSSVSSAPAKTCPQCFAVVQASCAVCPDCGNEFKSKPRTAVEEHEGDLVDVAVPSDDDLRAAWQKLCEECVSTGYKPAWVWVRWKEQYGTVRPPEGCVPPSAEECAANRSKRVSTLDEYARRAIKNGYAAGWFKSQFKMREGQWPSLELFKQTSVADEIAAVGEALAGLARWADRTEPVSVPAKVGPVKVEPVHVANDVELVDYAL